MRQLVLLRGAPGAGKSSYIKSVLGLESFTLSPDTLRQQCGSPVFDTLGNPVISQKNDKQVWDYLFEILEQRMERGEFTIVDATHSTHKLMKRYEKLAKKYRYRVFSVTLEVDLDTLLERNKNRTLVKQVPVDVIENIHERLKHEKIPSFIKEVEPDKLLDTLKWNPDFMDTSKYNKFHVIGDIHSCFSVLNKAIPVQDIQDNQDELYIFCGDYFDRGLEHKQTFDYIEMIHKLPNVILLEGNHEKYLKRYVNSDNDNLDLAYSGIFVNLLDVIGNHTAYRTYEEFLCTGITPKRAKSIVNKLQQVVYFKFDGQYYVITHGGIVPKVLDDLHLVPTEQLINGIGPYEFDVDCEWKSDVIQLHGHRNIYRLPLVYYPLSINLEGRVEKGGELRVFSVTRNGNVDFKTYDNDYYDSRYMTNGTHIEPIDPNLTINDYVKNAKQDSKNIKFKPVSPNIYSINFTHKAFRSKEWNQLSVRARGLFVSDYRGDWEIVARGYNKFFNINEMPETKIENLPDTIKFPLTSYFKENGYLGLISYDTRAKDLLFSTKSTNNYQLSGNEYAKHFEKLVKDNQELYNVLLETMSREENQRYTLVFEVCDSEFDPHIVEYKEPEIYLLDLVENTLEGAKANYDDIVKLSKIFNVRPKEHYMTFVDWEGFYNWYTFSKNNLDIEHEGFVFEDSNGFMFKFKSKWYSDWKYMRGVKEGMKLQHKNVQPVQYVLQKNPELRDFYYWLKDKPKEYLDRNIISLRNEFEQSRG